MSRHTRSGRGRRGVPEWFTNLAYITLAAVMVLFLGALSLALVIGVVGGIRTWLEERMGRR